jgi:hypothetical protein
MIKQPNPQPGLSEAAFCFAHALVLPVIYQSEPLLYGWSRVPKQDILGIDLVPKVRNTQIDISSY